MTSKQMTAILEYVDAAIAYAVDVVESRVYDLGGSSVGLRMARDDARGRALDSVPITDSEERPPK